MKLKITTPFPGGHAAVQMTGFTGGLVSREDGKLHHLLEKQRDIQAPAEDALQFGRKDCLQVGQDCSALTLN